MKNINFRNYFFDGFRSQVNKRSFISLFDGEIPADLTGYKTMLDMFNKSKYIAGISLNSVDNNASVSGEFNLDFGSGASRSDVIKQCFNANGTVDSFPQNFTIHKAIGFVGASYGSGFNDPHPIPSSFPSRPAASLTAASNLSAFALRLSTQGSRENYDNNFNVGYANGGYRFGASYRIDTAQVKPVDFVYLLGSTQDLLFFNISVWYIPEGQTGWVNITPSQINTQIQGSRHTIIKFPRVMTRDIVVGISPVPDTAARALNLFMAGFGVGSLDTPQFDRGVIFSVKSNDSDRNNITDFQIVEASKINSSLGSFKLKAALEIV